MLNGPCPTQLLFLPLFNFPIIPPDIIFISVIRVLDQLKNLIALAATLPVMTLPHHFLEASSLQAPVPWYRGNHNPAGACRTRGRRFQIVPVESVCLQFCMPDEFRVQHPGDLSKSMSDHMMILGRSKNMTARIILQTILKPPTTTCLNGDIVQLAKQGLWTDEWENPLSCHLVLSQKPKEYFEKNYGGFILFFHLEFKINYNFKNTYEINIFQSMEN